MKSMFTSSLLIGALFFQNILAGDYSNLPDEISKQVAAQFLHKNKYSDSRCNSDQQYCDSNRVSCMKHNENLREVWCARYNSCPSGQTCYLSNPCPANRSTGCTTNACYGQPCHNGGSCSMDSNAKGYSCHCQFGFDPATNCLTRHRKSRSLISGCHKCKNGGRCLKYTNLMQNTYYTKCFCPPGFNGNYCENNINECQSSPCVHGNCTDDVNMYTCDCQPGFTGVNCDTDLNKCRSSPCVHGNCIDDVNNFTCECQPGFTGVNCDTDINKCVHWNCTDSVNKYNRGCQVGFTGVKCDTVLIDVNATEADSTLLPPHVTTINSYNNTCRSFPCVHGNCTDYVNNYTCECHPGFTGVNCDTEIINCQNFPCVNGNCTDHVNNYTCECHPGFTGVNCDTEIINCQNFPCVNGNCTDHVNNYTCECHPGFTGVNCDKEIINCQNFPCVNGNCTDHVNNYTCECHPGFTGVNCDTEISGCISSPCVHGTCQNNTATYSCSCDSLYGGLNCDEVNASVVVPLVAVPVAASALGGLGFTLWRKKIGKKNSTSPSPDDQELGQSEDSERNPDNVQSC
ncbi:fibropellin-1 [Magallana gigas]|uniref:fibropellin-1 n=1 Tax=Magallana gigas TaxID=29159 RepID=UPI0033416819